ncbi:MAG: type II toxin-antitoxin system Phd/YefM family antitoxin [Desulfobacteraceae bacterium]
METMTVAELKARFSSVLAELRNGKEVVISYGKRREKVAVLIPYSKFQHSRPRRLGVLKHRGKCVIHDDFKMSDRELLES